MTAAAQMRLASWRWIVALILAPLLVASLIASLSLQRQSVEPRGAAPGASDAPEALTPPVARIAQRNPGAQIEVIARFTPGTSPAAAKEIVRSAGGRVTAQVALINGLAAELTARQAARLAEQEGVYAVSLNARVKSNAVSIDPRQLATSFNASVRSPEVWSGTGTGGISATGKGVGVAILDTGVSGDLPDFRVSQSDPTSRVRVVASMHPDALSDFSDGYGHGTHVAGLIAGNGDNRGDALDGRYAGTAPEADIISVKVSDNAGNATLLDVINGLQFIVDHREAYNIRIANLSLNSTVAESYMTDPLDAAVEQAWFSGIAVVVSAGNAGTAADAVNYAPANDPYVITVGAVHDRGTKDVEDDVLADWSSRGVTQDGFTKPEILAPGAHIVSNLAPNSEIASLCPSCVRDGEYFQMGGTSMAAGVASGVAALLLERNPHWTPNELKGALANRLRDIPGVGGEAASDKALSATSVHLTSNEGLTPSSLIDTATWTIDWERARWSRARWSEVELDRARWSRARWSLSPETVEEQSTDTETSPSRARWSRARWSHSFSL